MPNDPGPADAPPLRLQLLGTPGLHRRGEPAQPLNREDAALLALLAVDGPTSRVRALALLWPERGEAGARNTLRQRLFRLRRVAGAEVIQTRQDLLQLAPDVAHDLDALAELQRTLAADPGACAGDLLAAHRFDDLREFSAWLDAARARWRACRADALAATAQALEAQGRIAEALAHAQRLVADEPWLEHARRRLIRLHYRRGDHSAALAAFEDGRRVLHEHLGESPSGETLALIALVRSGAALPPVASGTASRTGPPPAALQRPPRLIGRSAAWAALDAARQRGTPALLIGDPGIGKTRLLDEFTAGQPGCVRLRARHGDAAVPWLLLGRVLHAACRGEANAAVDAWVASELARIVPEWGAPPTEPLDPLRLQRAAEMALAGADARVIVVDDIQWADAASLAMLPALWAGAGPRWLLAMRAAEQPPAVAHWRSALRDDAIQVIELHPLAAADTAALIESLGLPEFQAPPWAQRLHRHSGGNPLFLLETLLALKRQGAPHDDLPLPDTVLATIQRRLAVLSPTAMQLAQVAALAGQDFDLDVAAGVLAMNALALLAPWHELEAAQVLAGASFAHDLIRDAVLQAVPAVIAQRLHREIAAVLAEHAPPHRTAWHWRQACAWHEAGEAFMQAARRAYDASHFAEAAGHFESAADCCEREGDRAAQQRALQELIGCHVKHHDLASAKHFALRLRKLAADAGESAWALDRIGDIANMSRDDHAAEATAREMLALGQRTDRADPGWGWVAFNATRKLAVALAHRGRSDEALALFDTQQAWADAHAAEWNVHVWLADRGYVLDLADRRGAARAAHDAAAQAGRAHANWYVVYAATRNRALAQHWEGRLVQALADIHTAVDLTEHIGDASVRHNPREASRRAVLLRDAGRHGESLALLEHSVATLASGHSPFWLAYCQDQLALGYLAVGQHARARALVQGEPGCDAPEAHATRWLVRARCARERDGRAAELPLAAVFSDPACPPRWRLLALLEQARGLPPEQASAQAQDVAAQAAARDLAGIALHAQLFAAVAAADEGMALRAALVSFEQGTHPTGLPPAEFMWLAAQALAARGDHGAAEAARQRATHRLRHTELPHVPEAFVDSFLHRHPVHRLVLAAAPRTGSLVSADDAASSK